MSRQISQFLSLLFSFIWILVIFLDYWYYHQPLLYQSLANFQYLDLMVLLGVVGVGIFFLLRAFGKNNNPSNYINGLLLSSLFFMLCFIIISFHIQKIDIPFTFTSIEVLRYVGAIIGVTSVTYLISASCFVVGDYFYEKVFSLSFARLDNLLIRLALGIIIFCISLFLIGALNGLIRPVVGGMLLIPLGLFYKRFWKFIKQTLIQPIPNLQTLNSLGLISVFMIYLFVALFYLQNIRPLPFGFDALAIYLNLPNLISQQGGLISGYSPYYWSLFSSVGHILFDSLSVVISLSVLGGILSGFCMYAICRKWMDVNFSLLGVALFFSLPMINYQFFRDVKTDLGLLFFMLVVMLLIVNYLKFLFPDSFSVVSESTDVKKRKIPKKIISKKKARKSDRSKEKAVPTVSEGWLQSKFPLENEFFILMGIVSGMVLGIKLTGLILIFSLVGILVYLRLGLVGFYTAAILLITIILIGGLDIASGLRTYHFGATFVMWGSFLLGMVGIGYLGVKKRQSLIKAVQHISILSLFALIVYLPWPIKNYIETGKISVTTLIEGRPTGPSKRVNEFIRNANN